MADARIKRRQKYKKTWTSAKRQLAKANIRNSYLESSDEENNFELQQFQYSSVRGNKNRFENVFEEGGSDVQSNTDNGGQDADIEAIWQAIDEANDKIASSDDDIGLEEKSLRQDIAGWANHNGIKHTHLDDLLKILRRHGHNDLPSTARSLLQTPQNITIERKSGMDYIYFPIAERIKAHFEQYSGEIVKNIDTISISLNVDGVPIFKSSLKTLWPILCSINIAPVKVFPVALTLGKSKPSDLDFLLDTIQDVQNLLRDGFYVQENHYNVTLKCIVCDAPARALVKAIKQYSGYYGCERCDQKGIWIRKMSFQETDNLTLRTDASFRNQTQAEHHLGQSPVCNLPIDMIVSFPLDYMHMCCLGVMKRMILVWVRGGKQFRLSAGQQDEISKRLQNLQRSIPDCFARKPRGLDEVDRWKATEFRQFLLYTGKLVLKGILKKELFEHFMTFSAAVCILLAPHLVSKGNNLQYARDLLKYFVEEGFNIYGPGFMVYNVHGLLHIADDAENLGPLDSCSAFPFENFLHQLKKLVRNGNKPLMQVVKRLHEMENSMPCHIDKTRSLSFNRPNNGYILNDQLCCEAIEETNEHNVNGQRTILCRVYNRLQPLARHPVHTGIIGAYKGNVQNTRMQTIGQDKLKQKAIVVHQADENQGQVIFLGIVHALVSCIHYNAFDDNTDCDVV